MIRGAADTLEQDYLNCKYYSNRPRRERAAVPPQAPVARSSKHAAAAHVLRGAI